MHPYPQKGITARQKGPVNRFMEKIVINGGHPLFGQVEISGSKNAALPIIYASVLVKGKCVLENIPDVSDIRTSFEILRGIGALAVTTLARSTGATAAGA